MAKFFKYNADILKISLRLYIPESRNDLYASDGSIFKLLKYNNTNSSDLAKEYKNWIREITNNRIDDSIGIDTLSEEKRFYTSVIYFNNLWKTEFKIENTKESKFLIFPNDFIYRKFMCETLDVTYKAFNIGKKSEFSMISLPYKESDTDSTAQMFMVYLVPTKFLYNTKIIWLSFVEQSKQGIYASISGKTQKVYVEIPKIEDLKFKGTFNENLLYTVKDFDSQIYTRATISFKIDECGTKSTNSFKENLSNEAIVCVATPEVLVNRPYLSFVYDRLTDRILFLIRDYGFKNKKVQFF